MNYVDIIALALSYSDREDAEVISRMDNFLNIVESRINRRLRVASMSARATLPVVDNIEYYGFPLDFGGLRDVEYSGDGVKRITLSYMSPEQMNNLTRVSNKAHINGIYYTIVAQQLQIYPPKSEGTLEIIYYRKIPGLDATDDENWLSIYNPDCYIFGLLVEISSFVKDAETATLWDTRFKEVLETISTIDASDRWSGTSLQTRIG